MQLQPLSFENTKNIAFFAVLVLFMMWLLKPYQDNNTSVPSQQYYALGLTCLNDFERTTLKSNHLLTNTYAKKVSKSKDMVLIRAQNRRNRETLQIECIYDVEKLLYLSVNDQKLEL